KRANGVRERRGAKAGMKFFGDGAAADKFPAFEDEWLEAASGEIKGGDERVGTAADEHYALSEGHGQFFSADEEAGTSTACAAEWELPEELAAFERVDLKPLLQSLRMTWLAMRPGAPMMPPPGCVAEPHI